MGWISVTAAQLKAIQVANIQNGGQTNNRIPLLAFGEKPTIDLPLRVFISQTPTTKV